MPSEHTGVGQRGRVACLRARLVAWLDAFIPEALRRGGSLELSRARMVVGSCLGMTVATGVLSGLLQLTPYARSMGVMSALWGGGYLGVLALLRWRASSRLPALLLCSLLSGGIVFITLHMDMLAMATHASSVLVPVLAVYLLGWRMGLGFSLLSILTPLVFYPLTTSRPGPSAVEWAMSIFTAVFVALGWAVSSLFLSFRTEAHAASLPTPKSPSASQKHSPQLHECPCPRQGWTPGG